jgi:hypothetical protein
MKRCPTCNRTYTDPNLTFCVEDGTPLKTEELDDESTIVSPYRPPGSYVPLPTGHEQRRRVWPWILGLVGAFGIGAAVLLIAAVVVVPRIAKRAETKQAPVQATTEPETTVPTEKNTETVNAPAPTNKDEVLAQLTDLENEWTSANLNADKKKLARILADDYVGPNVDGRLFGKAEYINEIKSDSTVEKWEFSDLQVQLAGDRATLTGAIKYVIEGPGVVEYNFIDRFVWRDGRWQATGSEIQRKE